MIKQYLIEMSSKDFKDKAYIKEMIASIDRELKNCYSKSELIDFVFSFRYRGEGLVPLQIKNEIKPLIEILEKIQPITVLEIGTANGGTLFLLSKVSSPQATMISIDLPQGPFGGHLYPSWRESIFQSFAKKEQQIHLLRENSHDDKTLYKIKKILAGRKFDFLFIDGDHSYEGVKKDFEMYRPLLAKDGVIAFHDITPGPKDKVGGVPEFWNEIKSKYDHFQIVENIRGGGYGIGILVNSENNSKTRYILALKTLAQFQNKRIMELIDNPLSSLLCIYNERRDLQVHFPEVKKGDYTKLINWAARVCDKPTEEQKFVNFRIIKFAQWYKDHFH